MGIFKLRKISEVLRQHMHIIIQENAEKEELSGRLQCKTLK